ncbi:hypothetical protein V5O48_016700 [Marasmius crinis-equi]|uniref:Uncharacterized protein n=1 Tax=Marasmius crinis-equi TaxID=585013 RepID=A0ABR3ER57_9AGAR
MPAKTATETAKTTNTATSRAAAPSSLATTSNWRARVSTSTVAAATSAGAAIPATTTTNVTRSVSPANTNPSNTSRKSPVPSSARSNASLSSKSSSKTRSSGTAKNQTPSQFSTPASSQSSLFSNDANVYSPSNGSVVDETNRVALSRGKKPLAALRTADSTASSATSDLADESEQEAPSVFTNQHSNESRHEPSVESQSLTATESGLQDYHSELRRRYVLHMLRAEDLEQTSFSYIDPQGIIIDRTNNAIYHPNRPNIIQLLRPVEWAEVKRLRTMYPIPFSIDDPNPNRRPRLPAPFRRTASGHPGSSPPPGDDGGDPNSNDNRNDRDPPPHWTPHRGRGNHRGTGGPPDDNGPSSDPDEPSGSSGASDDDSEPENSNAEQPEVTRYNSVEPTLSNKKKWTYDPTPQSEEEMLKAAFKPLEDLIVAYLFCKPLRGNTGVQKTLIQSLPKPDYYRGEDDMTIFFEWVRALVRWLNAADLCGRDIRWSSHRNTYVRTSVDIQRTSATVAFLKGLALQHYEDVIEPVPDDVDPDDPLQGRWTFIQLIASLYRRFIHDASLHKVADRYESVRYSKPRGVEGLFNSLKKHAKALPTPPDAYTFRKRLMILLPAHYTESLTKIHKVTAERSTLDQIMDAALTIEQGEKADEYYQEARRKLERNQRKRSRSRSRRRYRSRDRRRRSQSPRGYQRRDGSPRRMQKVDGRRYSVKPYSQRRDDRPETLPRRDNRNDRPRSNFKDRKDFKPFVKPDFNDSGRPTYQNRDQPNSNRVFKMTDDTGNTYLFKMTTEDEEKPTDTSPSDNEGVCAQHDTSDAESSHRSYSPGPAGGSQYSDSDTELERAGAMHDDCSYDGDSEFEDYSLGNVSERFAAARDSDSESNGSYYSCSPNDSEDDNEATHLRLDFTEYFRSIEAEEDGGYKATVEPKLIRSPTVLTRPKRSPAEKRCLAAWVEFNGVKAFTLFDSGSTADAISPDFAKTTKLRYYRLETPVTFQLGTKGSRSRITHGCTTKYSIPASEPIAGKDYFDIANIDRYDAVVGTVFMRRHGLMLDFKRDKIRTDNSVLPTLSEGEELAELARRSAKRVQAENLHLENVNVRPRPKQNGTILSQNVFKSNVQASVKKPAKGKLTEKTSQKH